MKAKLALCVLIFGFSEYKAESSVVCPMYPGGWDYAESRLFFDGGFLWRSGYRVRGEVEDIRRFYKNFFTGNGWEEISADTINALSEAPPDFALAFENSDVVANVAGFAVAGEDYRYIALNVRFPWQITGGPGGFGRDEPLYPEGKVVFRLHQTASDHFMEYEMVECTDAPSAVWPYIAMELRQRGWRADRERALFRAELGFDDNIRMFSNQDGESFMIMALPPDLFLWKYVFLRKGAGYE